MNEPTPAPRPEDSVDMDVWKEIAAFEQLLETMPHDLGTLECLIQAYEMLGDRPRARDYLYRLGETIIAQGLTDQYPSLARHLRLYRDEDPQLANLADMLAPFVGSEEEARAPDIVPLQPEAAECLRRESALADRLLGKELLSAEDHVALLKDMRELAANPQVPGFSALHTLQDRRYRTLDAVMAFLCRDAKISLVPIHAFEPVLGGAPTLLAPEESARWSAAPFDQLGAEVLVAVLNPYDEALRRQIRERLGRPCRFYLTTPADFDAWLERTRELPR